MLQTQDSFAAIWCRRQKIHPCIV